jgi:hypothetical protein
MRDRNSSRRWLRSEPPSSDKRRPVEKPLVRSEFDCGKYTRCYKTFLAFMEGLQTRNKLNCSVCFTVKITPYFGIFLFEHVSVTCMPLIRRVLVRMIGFISSWVTHSLIITLTHRQYSVISRLHSLQSTVAHALGISRSTSRLPATDLDAQL